MAAERAATVDAVERFGDRMARLALVRPKQPESLPVHITRKRIYVLPTGFGLFIGLMLGTRCCWCSCSPASPTTASCTRT